MDVERNMLGERPPVVLGEGATAGGGQKQDKDTLEPVTTTGGGGEGEWGGGGSPSAVAKVDKLDDTLNGIDVVPPTGADGPTPDSPPLTRRKIVEIQTRRKTSELVSSVSSLSSVEGQTN
jgi:hypothetical protein